MFHVDPSDPTPVDAQLIRTVRSAVGAGLLAAGERLPTVRQLAVDLRVGANAVARAYEQLERQGVIETRQGVGTVVSLRFGRYQGLRGPGPFSVIPFVDSVSAWVDQRTVTTAFTAEETLTSDTVPSPPAPPSRPALAPSDDLRIFGGT